MKARMDQLANSCLACLAGGYRAVGRWETEYRCVSCEVTVSDHVKMYSSGRCPGCGYKGPDACTIMDVTEHARRRVRHSWWRFWDWHWEYKEVQS